MARVVPVDTIGDKLLAAAEQAAGGSIRPEANVYRTLAVHPDLFLAWLALGGHLLGGSALPPPVRELIILRTGILARGRYPVAQHVRIGKTVGLSDDDTTRVATNPTSDEWPADRALALTAVDEVSRFGRVAEPTMKRLVEHDGPRAVLDLIATIAFYRMASWMLNACRTPLDEGQLDPGLLDGPIDPGLGSTNVDRASVTDRAPHNVVIPPLPLERWPRELVDETEQWPRFGNRPELRRAGVYGTLANNPELFSALGGLMAHLLVDNTLSDRRREIVIVRSCLHDRGAYPYRQHVGIAATAGVDDRTLLVLGDRDPELTDPAEAAMVAAIDELHRTNDLSNGTWERLCRHFAAPQIMDMIATAGFYGLISFVLNSAGTPLEPGTIELPPRPFEKGPL